MARSPESAKNTGDKDISNAGLLPVADAEADELPIVVLVTDKDNQNNEACMALDAKTYSPGASRLESNQEADAEAVWLDVELRASRLILIAEEAVEVLLEGGRAAVDKSLCSGEIPR